MNFETWCSELKDVLAKQFRCTLKIRGLGKNDFFLSCNEFSVRLVKNNSSVSVIFVSSRDILKKDFRLNDQTQSQIVQFLRFWK